MSDASKIEWTDATWNPVTGCTEVSPGCDHCYAKTFAERWRGIPGHHFEQGFDMVLRPDRLTLPLKKGWTKPRRIFVTSMSDLFHDAVPGEYIAQVFAVMALASQHTFQVLTKRHGRMKALLSSDDFSEVVWTYVDELAGGQVPGSIRWPLPNVWLGVSVENQQWANIRIPALVDTPAAVRFLSCEPLLGPVDLEPWLPQMGWSSTTPLDGTLHLLTQNGRCDVQDTDAGWRHEVAKCRQCTNGRRISWVIVGGESGHGARPMHPSWARDLRDQCTGAGVAFHYKQHGAWAPGSDDDRLTAAVAYDGEWLAPSHRLWEEKAHTDEENRRDWAIVHRSRHKSERELDGRTWDEFPDIEVPGTVPA